MKDLVKGITENDTKYSSAWELLKESEGGLFVEVNGEVVVEVVVAEDEAGGEGSDYGDKVGGIDVGKFDVEGVPVDVGRMGQAAKEVKSNSFAGKGEHF